MHRRLSALAALAVVAALALPAPSIAQGRGRTKVGSLTCDISAGIGLIITSKKELTCMFTPSQPGPREVYTGSITKFGLDLAARSGAEIEAEFGDRSGVDLTRSRLGRREHAGQLFLRCDDETDASRNIAGQTADLSPPPTLGDGRCRQCQRRDDRQGGESAETPMHLSNSHLIEIIQ